jgi:hypothetical protein
LRFIINLFRFYRGDAIGFFRLLTNALAEPAARSGNDFDAVYSGSLGDIVLKALTVEALLTRQCDLH